MGKVKKIIVGVLVVAVAAGGISAGLMQLRKNSQKTVQVTPVSGLLQEFYTPSTTLDGTITSSATQTVNGDKDLIIDQIYVTKGDAVSKGDPLVSFDTTLVEMELNIAKLKRQKLEQDMNKAVNRLKSLQNGGPVEETDAGTDADDLNSTSGSDSTGDSDMTPDDTLSSAADMSGNYLAAAIHPLLLSAFTDGDAADSTSSDDDNAAEGNSQDTDDATDSTSADNDAPVYTDPSANGFSDGEDNFDPGKNETPEPSPTPTPALDDNTTYFDPYYRKGDPNITDGDEPFYQKLDADSIPFTGSGTEDDPYVYLCSSAKEKVTVMGSFFNKLAGYSEDGTKVVHQGGYWYQLEFHQDDTIADYEDRKTSCTGYYLINGSLLEKPVYEFAEVEFTLADASRYDENPDDGGDDTPGGDDVEPTGTPVSRADAIKYQQRKIASLKLDMQESDIKISQLEKKAGKKLISSKLDGTVTSVGDISSGETTDGKALIKVKSSDGFYVVGSVSELMLDDIKEGTNLSCTSYTSGSFDAEVVDVSEYPVTGNSYYGNSNPNVSYYAFTAVVTDKSLQLEDQDWVTINYEASSSEGSMVIQKAFVRSDSSKNYVYKDDNGVLKKQEISVGATVDSGYSVIVNDGLSEDDLIAFPYGKDVKEGAKTEEVTLDQMYGY